MMILQKIFFKLNLETIALNITKAIPCGLILHEIISNSLKYAFPENYKNEVKDNIIKIDLYSKSDSIYIGISDNGIGYEKKNDFSKTNTLGLKLVNLLEKQIKGSILINETINGIGYLIEFKGNQ